MNGGQVLAAGQIGRGCGQFICAEQYHNQPAGRKAGYAVFPRVFQQTQPANDWRGEYGRALALVVQAYVAAYDRQSQLAASIGHPRDAPFQLIIDVGPFRVAEIEAVGQRNRFRPHAGQVAGDLRNDALSATIGIKETVAAIAVYSDRDGFAGFLDAQHRGISGSRPDYGVGLHLVVVLSVNVPFAGDVRRCQ